MTHVAKTFDKDEERRLLEDWLSSVQFDKPSKGIPELEPEEDDEGGTSTKGWAVRLSRKLITPGGRVGSDRRLGSRANRENWVERSRAGGGSLPKYIRIVRNGLMKAGMSESRATAMAVAAIKRWARGGDNVRPAVQAAAAAALAQWEAMKSEA